MRQFIGIAGGSVAESGGLGKPVGREQAGEVIGLGMIEIEKIKETPLTSGEFISSI
jgi:hypothetical protein